MTSHPRNAMCIVCTDHWRSLEFYRDAFGAEVISREMGTCPWLRIGDLAITLLANTDKPSELEHSEQAMAMIFLQVDDLHAAYHRAVKHGAKAIDPPQSDDVHFVVADPDGIIIEVMQAEMDTE
ncbi:MAG: VOC family protein [Planctomycetaceae bacterium]